MAARDPSIQSTVIIHNTSGMLTFYCDKFPNISVLRNYEICFKLFAKRRTLVVIYLFPVCPDLDQKLMNNFVYQILAFLSTPTFRKFQMYFFKGLNYKLECDLFTSS